MKFVCPLVVVKDVTKSRELYENILGQKVKFDFGENVTFEGDFAIHQEDHFRSLISNVPVTKKSNSFELYFEEDDLAAVEKKIKSAGLEFVHELLEQPWRQKCLRFYDYDGNIIEIGERMEHVAYRLSLEGLSLEEIAEITYMPIEGVKASIKEFT